MRLLPVLIVVPLAACTQAPVAIPASTRLTPPDATLMQRPKQLADVPEGGSIYNDAAVCRAEYGRLATKVVGLQNWATIVTNHRARATP